MINSKILHDGEASQSELPRCTRAFVQEASKLHRAGFSKETVLQILKHYWLQCLKFKRLRIFNKFGVSRLHVCYFASYDGPL